MNMNQMQNYIMKQNMNQNMNANMNQNMNLNNNQNNMFVGVRGLNSFQNISPSRSSRPLWSARRRPYDARSTGSYRGWP